MRDAWIKKNVCGQSFYLFLKVFKNDNKGIVFEARWFVRPDINTDVTIIFA